MRGWMASTLPTDQELALVADVAAGADRGMLLQGRGLYGSVSKGLRGAGRRSEAVWVDVRDGTLSLGRTTPRRVSAAQLV